MFRRVARASDVVDVDAGDGDARQRSLEDDREAVADQLEQSRVVDPRTRHDQAVGMLGPQQRGVRAFRTVEHQRLDHHPEAAAPGRRREAAQRLDQDRVAGDLLGRLAQDQGDDVTPSTGQLARGSVG